MKNHRVCLNEPLLAIHTHSSNHSALVVSILILISFFTFLSLAETLSSIVIRAGIIGPIAVGIIYGKPLANILHETWQETFLAIGYVGLILIIFEGGLTTRMDLLKKRRRAGAR